MAETNPRDPQVVPAPETGKRAYEPPRVESVQLSQEAAEALT